MTLAHIAGYPRMGPRRELKRALEACWAGHIDSRELLQVAREIRSQHWEAQRAAGLDWITVGDFSLYDQILDTSCMLDAIPARFRALDSLDPLQRYFCMARGSSSRGAQAPACEMTKYFDTNYHYLVPELEPGQALQPRPAALCAQVREAQQAGHPVKVVLTGPLTWLWLAKMTSPEADRLTLLPAVLDCYQEILRQLGALGVRWVQLDEPALVQDLPPAWFQAGRAALTQLSAGPCNLLLATFYGGLGARQAEVLQWPAAGFHLDAVRAPECLQQLPEQLPAGTVLSLGVIDGRNVWRADLTELEARLQPLRAQLGDRLWVAPSCSLLHVPEDLALESRLPASLRDRLAFARQKLDETACLARLLDRRASRADRRLAAAPAAAAWPDARTTDGVQARLQALDAADSRRSLPFAERRRQQIQDLPPLPTTTIGSFPQTAEIRRWRRAYRDGAMDRSEYDARLRDAIADAIRRQEALGLDVLVHGEAERNDMVEYFGEQLDGFAFTDHGWVQSYGSRCVKPPIIHADVSRPGPMTVEWTRYAQSLTSRPVKGMLTGPVTLLQWSFVRTDQPRADTCRQLALALRDEVRDLIDAGIRIIQVDEPALREGLPLARRDQPAYLAWASECFRLATAVAGPAIQIHTHMCYSEFNDIIASIAELDADVITIETARSHMELLEAFEHFEYPNEIGPGVYDIHSPDIPSTEAMVALLRRAAQRIPPERLWVNPDCGLKTRAWPEVEAALTHMVAAARTLRQQLAQS